jgi:hypothetical protein
VDLLLQTLTNLDLTLTFNATDINGKAY